MTSQTSDSSSTAESWDTYWHGARHSSAFTGGGSSHPLVLSFWDEFFKGAKTRYEAPRIIDIASGNGAVIDSAQSIFTGSRVEFTCLDISESAISLIKQRFQGVLGIVADARAIPLESAVCDIATSQFGVEYAGVEAIDEVARLVAPGGSLALLLHNKSGSIYKQCTASLDAIEKMQKSGFIPKSTAMLKEGFAACRGGNQMKFQAAAEQLVPAVRTIESIMQQHGPEVADGTIVRLYQDVRTIGSRMQNYEPDEVLGWLERMQVEVQAFRGRMASMCDAAIDAKTFEQLCQRMQGQGFEMLRSDALENQDRGLPLAWAIVAAKA